MRRSNLNTAIDDVDSIIDLLTSAREQVAGGLSSCHVLTQHQTDQPPEADAHKIGLAMTTLQNPVKARFEAINQDLKDVTKAQKAFGKSLDKVRLIILHPWSCYTADSAATGSSSPRFAYGDRCYGRSSRAHQSSNRYAPPPRRPVLCSLDIHSRIPRPSSPANYLITCTDGSRWR